MCLGRSAEPNPVVASGAAVSARDAEANRARSAQRARLRALTGQAQLVNSYSGAVGLNNANSQRSFKSIF